MKHNGFVTMLFLITAGATANAQDLIDRRGAGSALRGEIVSSTRTELTVKVPNKPEVKIPANEIVRVRFDGEKPQVNLVRAEEAAGRYKKALDGYREALKEAAPTQTELKTDLEFLIARTIARLSAEDPKLIDEAIKAIEGFRSAHADNFRDFEALLLLGNLHLAKNDFDKSRATFAQLASAPWDDYKLAARNAEAKLLLTEEKFDEALKEYDAVIQAASEPAVASRRADAILGKATVLEKKNDFAQAAKMLEQIVEQSGDDDAALQAQACVRLGSAYQSAGNTRDALLAYLRVDVLFFSEKSPHAEALYHLSQLWARDNKPERAADAANALQAKYPDSEWAKKLSSKTAPETR